MGTPVRLISQTEAGKALDCQASWDFAYGRTLAGSSLKPKTVKPFMDDGSVWGRMLAAWHDVSATHGRFVAASDEMYRGLGDMRKERRKVGLPPDEADAHDRLLRLHAILEHHHANPGELRPFARIADVERRLIVPVPRPGPAGWALELYIDLVAVDEYGTPGIVENKLRGSVTRSGDLVVSRQVVWYAWAWREVYGTTPVVIVDERVNGAPSATVKRNKDESLAVVQSCALSVYIDACRLDGVEPLEKTVAALNKKVWAKRHTIHLGEDELDDAGREVASAALLIVDLEAGRWPIRNKERSRCGGCFYRPICRDTGDVELVDALFVRKPAKRDRTPREGDTPAVAAGTPIPAPPAGRNELVVAPQATRAEPSGFPTELL